MLTRQEVEQRLQNASGEFEYTVDGNVEVPPYKYAYFAQGSGTYPVFVGRDTTNGIRETGVYISFPDTVNFWGVKTPLGGTVKARYMRVENVWEGKEGFVTGIVNSTQTAAFIEFEFTASREAESKEVKGFFILKLN